MSISFGGVILPIPGLPGLPGSSEGVTINTSNIQHDILVGMTKSVELFFFFGIQDPTAFKSALTSNLQARITTVAEVLDPSQAPATAVNIAFSASGLKTLGIDPTSVTVDEFVQGQYSDASSLGDSGANWVSQFAGTSIHGLLMLQATDINSINAELSSIQSALGNSIVELYQLQAAIRPGDQAGHEHFGYLDGISQPGVAGFTTTPLPGQDLIEPGVFLLGETGDSLIRPDWSKDSSFLVFRQLQQKVPEFNAYLLANALTAGGLTKQQGADLLGARMVGRWKSGAPVALCPKADDPTLGGDPQRNNNFVYTTGLLPSAANCPYSAHLRKTNPRDDFTPIRNNTARILRSGIPYGPEVTAAETTSGASDPSSERGLAFVCYQSSISASFRFIQQSWANQTLFFPRVPPPGFDPIVGANFGNSRTATSLDPSNALRTFTMSQDFVVPRGGEYFFTPSISALSHIASA